ncbi:MAG TPA: hypothetical protein VEL10_12070 [Gaiellaceae bacterium]|nr:hypothetical protein [Gaiellaceae bacterium]
MLLATVEKLQDPLNACWEYENTAGPDVPSDTTVVVPDPAPVQG